MALVDPAISLLAFCCCRRRRQSRCQQSSALLMTVPITLALIFREALTAAFKAPLHAPWHALHAKIESLHPLNLYLGHLFSEILRQRQNRES